MVCTLGASRVVHRRHTDSRIGECKSRVFRQNEVIVVVVIAIRTLASSPARSLVCSLVCSLVRSLVRSLNVMNAPAREAASTRLAAAAVAVAV